MDKKTLISALLVVVLAAYALFSSCGRKGPEAPPDTAPPTVVSTSPYYNEANVPLNAVITVTFNEAMSGESVNAETVSLETGTGAVAGTASCSGATAVFTPAGVLSPNTTYRVNVKTSVRDAAGNAMVAAYVFPFVTGTTLSATTFTVTASAGANGSITPPTRSVISRTTGTFTITPAAGYQTVLPVGGTCGGSLAGTTYTTNPIAADCTVEASFAAIGSTQFTVTAQVSGGNGTITPSSTRVNAGSAATFTLQPASNYHIASVTGCGGNLAGSTYTTGAVSADCTVTASFTANAATQYTLTAQVSGGNGTITPSSTRVNAGSSTSFTLQPASNYHIASVTGCGGNLAGSTYATGAVNADCTVTAAFAADAVTQFTVSTKVSAGKGSFSPDSAKVNSGSQTSFSVVPATGYRISSVSGCGGSLNGSTYTTGSITGACTVSASFTKLTQTVTPAPGPHGLMVPALPQTVSYEDTASFAITPDATYHIASASGCNGALAGSVFITAPVIADCTVAASFALNTYTVTPSAGLHGSIVPGTAQQAPANTSVVFTVTPDASYRIASVSGCSGLLSGFTYTTAPVTADCTVAASFAAITRTVTPSAGSNGQIAPADPQQVTQNSTVSFTLTPVAGYAIGTVSGCGGTLAGSVYTTAPVTADCTVTATFVQSMAI